MPGSSNPPRVSHDASIYTMYEAEAAEINAAGGQVRRVVLDFKLKKKIYGELNKKGGYGNHSYARRQEDLVSPSCRSSTARSVCLTWVSNMRPQRASALTSVFELAAENNQPAPMSQKLRADFKIYGVNLTCRGRRAEWKGRELTAEVLAS